MPLANKYKGNDDELTFPKFKTKLQTMFARFPDALKTDHDQIQFALQSMEGTPFKYFAPYANSNIVDDIGIVTAGQEVKRK
ncbi:hypothetical protein BGZ76_008259, partial [Entomortierella beljakovae]